MLPRPSEPNIGLRARVRTSPLYLQVAILLGILLASLYPSFDLARLLAFSGVSALAAFVPLRLARTSARQRRHQLLDAAYQDVLRHLRPCLVWAVLPDQRLAFVNQATLDYAGVRQMQELQECLSMLHKDDVAPYFACLHATTCSAPVAAVTVRMLRYDGQYRRMSCRILASYDVDGALLQRISACHDVDPASQGAPQPLLRDQPTYRHMLDFVPACVYLANNVGDIVYANQAAMRTLGAPVESILGQGWLNFVHPESVPLAIDAWSKARQAATPLDVTLLFKHGSGEYRWQHVTAIPWRDDMGQVMSWYVIGVEIHERVKAQEALDASKYELSKIIETLPLNIWCASAQGQPRDWLEFIHPEDRTATAAAFAQAIETGTPYMIFHRLRGADGSYRWHEERAAPLRDADGCIQRWYGVAIDVDDRVSAERHLRETRTRLKRATQIAALAELSASVAHEINQPLTAIIANAQAARRWMSATPADPAQALQSLNMVLRDGRAASDIIRSMRALFRREAPCKSAVRVEEMLREAVRLVREDRQHNQVQLAWRFAADLPLVPADRTQIQQVLVNLVCNGIDAAQALGRTAELSIHASLTPARQLLIEIMDNGPGISDPAGIFDAFVTSKASGMGIGLAISRSIVLAHGGQLAARNLEGGGACFSLLLPTA